jgi:tRNA pseudouridine55 synthase
MLAKMTEALPATLCGVLNVKKDPGWTSHDVVAKVRACLKGARVGHAGTLDPAARGVLPLLVGRATRIAEYLLDWDKEYQAVLRLGETTDTLDATGSILLRRSTEQLRDETVRTTVSRFQGAMQQVPPMFSAVKVAGVPLYKAARAGRTVRRLARQVTVHRIDVLKIVERDVWLRLTCSKGTYVRVLCADIGEALGVGGHLLALERTRVGPFTIDQALPVDDICQRIRDGEWVDQLMSIDEALSGLPALVLSEDASERARHGVGVPSEAILLERSTSPSALVSGQAVRLKDPTGQLFGLGTWVPGSPEGSSHGESRIRVVKVFGDV